jgi:hypothetical protein
MRIPSECHLTLYDTVDCILGALPREDLLIVGHSDKKAKVIMHDDEDFGVDGLKELDLDPYTHDGIHIDDIMEHGPSPIHCELVPSLPVTSNLVISIFQQGYQAIPVVKLKDNGSNALDHAYHFFSPMVPLPFGPYI